jgi:predicted nucleic acid-binding protein
LENEGKSDSGKGEPGKAVLYQEIDGAKTEVGLPLTSLVDVNRMMNDLDLPSYVDLEYFPMRTAIAMIWASQNAHEIHRLYPQAYEKKVNSKPISALLFGGGAMKVHCEHSNGGQALSRAIKDVDVIVPRSQGSSFCKLLLNMDKAFGTQFKFFRTKGDAFFNAMRQGQRYRIRTINGVTENGLPTVTVLDVFCDRIDLRHRIEVKDSFERCRDNLYTIGLECMLMSKCQFITDASKTDVRLLTEHGQEFRVLPYDRYSPEKAVLGMEEKDVKDVCAVFLDHPIGQGKEEINPDKMRQVLGKDKKLGLTVTLNLQNMKDRTGLLQRWLTNNEATIVVDRLQTLLDALPKIEKKWDKPWWNTAVETPIIG